MIEYEGIVIYTNSEVYKPAEDTFLLIENLDIQRKDEVLEIGTGTGLIALYSAQRSKTVVATDIDETAINCALKNSIANKIYNIELRAGSVFEAVENQKFDLILLNAVPESWNNEKITDRFINNVKNYLKDGGRIQIAHTHRDPEKTIIKLKELGFEAEITAREKGTAEEIIIISGKL